MAYNVFGDGGFLYAVTQIFAKLKGLLDSKYVKPSSGIPKTDLASDVQTSLGKADTALQTAPITDVQVNGTSVVQSGVANVPLATPTIPGVITAGTITVSGTTPTINALPGVRYVCGEVTTLDITFPASGIVDVTFESGSTATVLTVTTSSGGTLKWANGFDPDNLAANTSYQIRVTDGEFGVADASGADSGAKSLGVVGAQVGDFVKVKAVDANGIPTAWEKANDPNGKLIYSWTRGEMYNVYTPLEIDYENGRVRFDTVEGLPNTFPGQYSGIYGYLWLADGSPATNTMLKQPNYTSPIWAPPKIVADQENNWVEFKDITSFQTTAGLKWRLYYKKTSPPPDVIIGANRLEPNHRYKIVCYAKNGDHIGLQSVQYEQNKSYSLSQRCNSNAYISGYEFLNTRSFPNTWWGGNSNAIIIVEPIGDMLLFKMDVTYSGASGYGTQQILTQKYSANVLVKNEGLYSVTFSWGNYPATFNGAYAKIYDLGEV